MLKFLAEPYYRVWHCVKSRQTVFKYGGGRERERGERREREERGEREREGGFFFTARDCYVRTRASLPTSLSVFVFLTEPGSPWRRPLRLCTRPLSWKQSLAGPLRAGLGGEERESDVGGGLLPLPANHMAPDLSLSLYRNLRFGQSVAQLSLSICVRVIECMDVSHWGWGNSRQD